MPESSALRRGRTSLDEVDRLLRDSAGLEDGAKHELIVLLRRTLADLGGAAAAAVTPLPEEQDLRSDEELFAFIDDRS